MNTEAERNFEFDKSSECSYLITEIKIIKKSKNKIIVRKLINVDFSGDLSSLKSICGLMCSIILFK